MGGKWVHRLSEINLDDKTANCLECGNVKIKIMGGRPCCQKAYAKKKRKNNYKRERPWRQHKKDICELCGFVPVNPCQLDVDHIDGNKKNNDLSNYQTLCANCHRLKTYINQDNIKNKPPAI